MKRFHSPAHAKMALSIAALMTEVQAAQSHRHTFGTTDDTVNAAMNVSADLGEHAGGPLSQAQYGTDVSCAAPTTGAKAKNAKFDIASGTAKRTFVQNAGLGLPGAPRVADKVHALVAVAATKKASSAHLRS